MGDIRARAMITYAEAARDAADYARGLVGDAAKQLPLGERIRATRTLRVLALRVLDRAVLLDLHDTSKDLLDVALRVPLAENDVERELLATRLTGSVWDTVAESLGLTVAETCARYADVLVEWRRALADESDPEGTAAAIDAWAHRHAEPWDPPGTLSNLLRWFHREHQ